jgi:hypothetical protein
VLFTSFYTFLPITRKSRGFIENRYYYVAVNVLLNAGLMGVHAKPAITIFTFLLLHFLNPTDGVFFFRVPKLRFILRTLIVHNKSKKISSEHEHTTDCLLSPNLILATNFKT